MRRADQVSGAVLLVFAVWFAVTAARQHPYTTPMGPGSGFLPLWLGIAMAVLATALLVGATRRPDPGEAWLPAGRALRRILAVLVGTTAFVALMPVFGMTFGSGLLLVALLRCLEGHGWGTTITVAVAAPAVNWLVFTHWLHVPFPTGLLGF